MVLKGNLAPDGAVIKTGAMDPRYLKHTGKALVFDDYNHMAAQIDRDDLEVDESTVLVLRNAGPLGGPGMPEWGMMPLPRKLLLRGVKDMVRISDARMSGTSYGTCVLHVAPESWVGGPLALIRTGDTITLDVPAQSLHVHLSEEELPEFDHLVGGEELLCVLGLNPDDLSGDAPFRVVADGQVGVIVGVLEIGQPACLPGNACPRGSGSGWRRTL